MSRSPDISGQKFGRLTAMEWSPRCSGDSLPWLCRCDCGKNTRSSHAHLVSGVRKSCGCAREKPERRSKLHKVWQQMHARCRYATHKDFHLYGGRGITVCQRWYSYANFIADMGERPPGMSIDRIDTNGNYEPSNCRWATLTEQARNTRKSIWLEHEGRRMALPDWADELGMQKKTLYSRIVMYRWPLERAFTEPVRPSHGGRSA